MISVKLNSAGITAWLKANSHMVEHAGNAVADQIGWPTSVHMTTGHGDGRPTAVVVVEHPGALAWQAQDGALTRAATAAGLDVTRYQ